MFQKWEVNGKEYNLRLDTSSIIDCEEKLGCNLLEVLQKGMPRLGETLDIVHFAMKKYNSGISRKDLNEIYDVYIQEGGTHIKFFTEIFMGIFKTSGFFTKEQAQEMEEAMVQAPVKKKK